MWVIESTAARLLSTEYSRLICGYENVRLQSDAKRLIPIAMTSSILPYHFYVGNHRGYGYWRNELRLGRRWLQEDDDEALPLYGIMEGSSGAPIEPPMQGDRIAGDMLMITRVPNPANAARSITVIGGLHGYSLESFFCDLEATVSKFDQLLKPRRYDYFQALIPYSIEKDRTVRPMWKAKGNWSARISPVDGARFLASQRHRAKHGP
jgi:hypothetical protein